MIKVVAENIEAPWIWRGIIQLKKLPERKAGARMAGNAIEKNASLTRAGDAGTVCGESLNRFDSRYYK